MPKPSVSIIIPAYNEEGHLALCLDSIARQTVKPLEVIVVDNNSTDGTVAVASRYPFVTVLHEPRQGVAYARDRGFNAARGDIIGRIDGDSMVSADWVETVVSIFAGDKNLAATSGRMRYYDVAWSEGVNAIDLFVRRRFARLLGREVALQAANMAIRRDVWHKVKSSLCYRSGLHEDFDLAIHTNWQNFDVTFDERLVASISARMADRTPMDFFRYVWLNPRSYTSHGVRSGRHIYPVAILVLLFYLPLRLMHRGYDHQEKRFSLKALLAYRDASRVNPATFID